MKSSSHVLFNYVTMSFLMLTTDSWEKINGKLVGSFGFYMG